MSAIESHNRFSGEDRDVTLTEVAGEAFGRVKTYATAFFQALFTDAYAPKGDSVLRSASSAPGVGVMAWQDVNGLKGPQHRREGEGMGATFVSNRLGMDPMVEAEMRAHPELTFHEAQGFVAARDQIGKIVV